MAEDLGERTEEATPRRLREAREEGNVAKSQDLGSAISLAFGTLIVWMMTMAMFGEGQSMLRRLLDLSALDDMTAPDNAWEALAHAAWSAMSILLPFMVLVMIGTWFAQFFQIGWVFSAKAIRLRGERLDPIRGLKRIVGPSGLIRVSLDSMKVLVVLSVAVLTMFQYQESLIGLPGLPMWDGVSFIGMMMLDLAFRTAGVLLLLGLLDYTWQRIRRKRELRMTKQQVRDDMKEAEGIPSTASDACDSSSSWRCSVWRPLFHGRM